MNKTVARLIFKDGREFSGFVFSEGKDIVSEVVFNTAMTGYQEILTDPSYSDQMVVMTYPMIGNYGVNEEDVESKKIFLNALIVREYVDFYSNWRSIKSLKSYLQDYKIWGITDVDTRALTQYIRDSGSKQAFLTCSTESQSILLKNHDLSTMEGANLADKVTCKKAFLWKKPKQTNYKVAMIDCGVKYNILDILTHIGCECSVFPTHTKPNDILDKDFDGLFISNGPGDPKPLTHVVDLIKACIGTLPIYGICLGHQLIAQALGAKTYKLKFGHHGANHPVYNYDKEKVEISSQNHGFSVYPDSLKGLGIDTTYINLNDQTIAGIRHKEKFVSAVQFHPEASPGPHDSRAFFDGFIDLMQSFKQLKKKRG